MTLRAPSIACLAFLLQTPSLLKAVDTDGNGICDVWTARYAAQGLVPGEDSDGDGKTNEEEAKAGTDPRDPSHSFVVDFLDVAANVDLEVPAQPGKRYRLFSAPFPNGPWSPVGLAVVANGSRVAFDDPDSVAGKTFYRVGVEDTDTDGDGVSDWAELQLGFNPTLGDSFSSGSPNGDGAAAVAWAQATMQGGLNITTVVGDAYEKENTNARFTFTRSAGAWPFAVFLRPAGVSRPGAGTAGSGEYSIEDGNGAAVSHRLIIPAGQSTMDLVVRPMTDTKTEVPEEVRWTVGGTSHVVTARVCDAKPTPENIRLFVAYLKPRPGVTSLGSGMASLRLAGDNAKGSLVVSFTNLKAPASASQLLAEGGGTLLSVPPSGYGGINWPVVAGQQYTADQLVLDALISGELSFMVFTSAATGGEIGANFQWVTGSTAFQLPAPPSPVLPVTGDALDREIARFLTEATFGPNMDDIIAMRNRVQTHGGDRIAAFGAWIDEQLLLPSPSHEALTRAGNEREFAAYANPDDPTKINLARDPNQTNRRGAWWTVAMNSPAQLRQRMAHALGQIFVVSEADAQIYERAYGLANYYDMLAERGSGSFRHLLEGVSLHPVMGHYLSHLRNQKAIINGSGVVLVSPDENYAREVMQLFSIGLVRLYPDGTLVLGADGLPIPTYTQNDITELARVFTGWAFSVYNNPSASNTVVPNTDFNRTAGSERFEDRWTNPMKMFPTFHDTGAKSFLGLSVPASQTGEQDLAMALDHLAAHANTAPFLARQLIQRFTSANPSPGYTHRVAQVFTTSGGNLGQTIKALLLDPEARDASLPLSVTSAGKPREPLLRHVGLLRALEARPELLLSDLSSHGYPAEELAKFPAGARHVRYSNTDQDLVQTPMDAPSVFNWYRPDFAPPGQLSENGLNAPEFQIANETTIVRGINYHYSPIFSGNGQSTVDFPDYVGKGYTPDADHMKPNWQQLSNLYLSETDTTGDGIFNQSDTTTFNNPTALRAAVTKVVDRLDLLLCEGSLKAKYGDTPGTPRSILIDGVLSIRSGSNNDATGQARSMDDRIKAAAYLITKNPAFAVQK
ncbi:MAG: DUF1800 family protein [Verrucomicrobiales bacterium]